MIDKETPGRHKISRSLHDGHTHVTWDKNHEPILSVKPGEEVHFDVSEASGGVISEGSKPQDVASIPQDKVNPVTGPVYVEGAKRGETLVVDVLELAPSSEAPWGWTGLIPGFGLLAEDFPEPGLIVSKPASAAQPGVIRHMDFAGIRIPFRPFAGTMGVAPADEKARSVLPPGLNGGNLDIRHLTAGSRLYLPIQVDGALFSVGDTHAAQGDGEVCGTAIEMSLGITLRFQVERRTQTAPQYRMPPATPPSEPAGFHVTTGIGGDLKKASQDAVRAMIDHLETNARLDAQTAYMLCSVAGDLTISEIVNAPNFVASFRMPLSLFA